MSNLSIFRFTKVSVVSIAAASLVSGCNSVTVPNVAAPAAPAATAPVATKTAISFANTTSSPSEVEIAKTEIGRDVGFSTASYDHATAKSTDSLTGVQYTLRDKLRYVGTVTFDDPARGISDGAGIIALNTPFAGMPTTGSATYTGTGSFLITDTGTAVAAQLDATAVLSANFATGLVDVTVGDGDQIKVNNIAVIASGMRSNAGTTSSMSGSSNTDFTGAVINGGGQFGGPNAEEAAAYFRIFGQGAAQSRNGELILTASK